jgi:hypothetical protein
LRGTEIKNGEMEKKSKGGRVGGKAGSREGAKRQGPDRQQRGTQEVECETETKERDKEGSCYSM